MNKYTSWDACLKFFNNGVHDKKGLETTELDYLKEAPSTQHFCNAHCFIKLIPKHNVLLVPYLI